MRDVPSQSPHRASRSGERYRGQRRAPRRGRVQRGRLGTLTGSLAVTLVIGSATLVTAVRGGSADAHETTDTAITEASLSEPIRTVDQVSRTKVVSAKRSATEKADTVVPQGSGSGRRIVFSQSRQRVWLIEVDGSVDRTYSVSGSKHDNLNPGTYAVQSRTEQATAFDYTGTMKWFVRFTTGRNAPIGFHSVPVDNAGKLEQTKAQLGTPLSSGCVRQWADDAKALWDWSPIGTKVVVTA